MEFIPFIRSRERISVERQDSDTALFLSLMYAGEFLLKSIGAFFVSAIDEDRDRQVYRLEHMLLRADGLGDWKTALDDIFSGPTSQYLAADARPLRTGLLPKSLDSAKDKNGI